MIDVSDICRMTLEAEDVRSKLDCWKKTCKEKRLALEQNGAWDGKAWETAYDIGKAVEKVDFIMTDLASGSSTRKNSTNSSIRSKASSRL